MNKVLFLSLALFCCGLQMQAQIMTEDEIMPYADGKVRENALTKISLSWFFDGAKYRLSQQYDKALTCYQKALKGYRKLGKTKDEISVLRM